MKVCTRVCTSDTEKAHGLTINALAAAIAALSPSERAKLAALLAAPGKSKE